MGTHTVEVRRGRQDVLLAESWKVLSVSEVGVSFLH